MGERITFRKNERLHTINPRWRGNPIVKGKFFNRQHRWRPGMGSVLKWRFSPNPQRKEKRTIKWNPKVHFLRSLDAVVGNTLIWLGHNSFFLQVGGKRFMIDPVYGSIPFVKRRSQFPANPSIFTNIDYLLISHDHFDHLDKPSVARLFADNPQMKLFCGIGTGALIKSWFPTMEVIEAAWYQQHRDGDLRLTFLPAQHWSKRGVNDGGERLWGAFMIEADGITIYNSGDTGYARHFSELPELFPHIDYCMIGIGAYKPRWFMKPNHISPYDALTASTDMNARITVPMHYGTFDLSDEPLFDPPHVFAAEARKRDMPVLLPELGEIVKLSHQANAEKFLFSRFFRCYYQIIFGYDDGPLGCRVIVYAGYFALCGKVYIISHVIKTVDFYSIVFEQVTYSICIVILRYFVLNRYSYATGGEYHGAQRNKTCIK